MLSGGCSLGDAGLLQGCPSSWLWEFIKGNPNTLVPASESPFLSFITAAVIATASVFVCFLGRCLDELCMLIKSNELDQETLPAERDVCVNSPQLLGDLN